MKALISSLLLVAAMPVLADSASNPRCEAKAADIQQQIQAAEAAGHDGKVKGLNTALEKVRSNCTDKELMRELEGKVRAARGELREREADLREAELSGDPSKIAKRQAKLEEARAELQQAETELTEAPRPHAE
ncbi:DUF1090 domain-containing protein [Pseudomonas seleniipraecipitans]|uniref:DUF1090 domain-containing protein n=1 Tax=Phytopseudomonas seleniipraecipitans TaxID=640205 RepID=A0ABY5J9W0_9GAMM|nr:DUF1090 domain-containing protein [Pseudomonas seleniipraecipitans]NQD80483.1 DUF1090 domain-containing protein [Pseudomonas sp. CrR14]UUD63744.1 DUF1090 domain-containing protein [Pseudomonas seleniipraecipitans]